MALISPRFTSSRKLLDTQMGRPIRQGAKGRSVHLVQMALLDLGYRFPMSTGSQGYSPDGDFGNETVQRLKDFQRDNHIPQSGAIDADTMRKLDARFPRFNHRVRLHFRSISLTNVPFQESLTWAEIVYGQYGIKMEFASGMSLGLSEADEERFAQVGDSCEWEISDGEYNELHSMGPAVPSTDLLVYYVRDFTESIVGCGGHAVGRPACTVGSNGTKWTTAHEVGHVLLTGNFNPVHAPTARNLMVSGTHQIGNTIPILTNQQVAKIRQHPCCMSI